MSDIPSFQESSSLVPEINFPTGISQAAQEACDSANRAARRSMEFLFDPLKDFYPAKAAQLEELTFNGVCKKYDDHVSHDPGSLMIDSEEGYKSLQESYHNLRSFMDSLESLDRDDQYSENPSEQ